eukprot:CAMPEP_0172153900 /NCGR_PEP_ID=MMETSP1050-20130122/1719_1 /TAXON_ID=233186 /ORGANISM="Cryptomonas curvata, Strain CCAP979/52" /LENGTH=289 /DNA_ID=CAMNT_0012822523 /DNA_START=44 /DNA_END=909 /DNA_ORIENTATION=+
MPEKSKVIVSNVGMRLEQIIDEGNTEKGKLVGIPGHWEDGATLMWDTEMKRLGLEPYKDDQEWNKLTDSKGNRLFGTQKSMMGGMWLRWKKPAQSNIEDVPTTVDFKTSMAQSVQIAQKPSNFIWNHPAIPDLFLDGFLSENADHASPGLASLASSVVLTIHILEDLVASAHTDQDRSACAAASKAFNDLLSFLTAIPGESTGEMINASLASAEKLLRQAAALTGVVSRIEAAQPVFGGKEEDFLRLIDKIVRRVHALQEGEFTLVPCGWARNGGDSHALVLAVQRERG